MNGLKKVGFPFLISLERPSTCSIDSDEPKRRENIAHTMLAISNDLANSIPTNPRRKPVSVNRMDTMTSNINPNIYSAPGDEGNSSWGQSD